MEGPLIGPFLFGKSMNFKKVARKKDLISIGSKAVEEVLKDFRNNKIACKGRDDGLIIRELNGELSPIIRLTIEDCLRIGITAIATYLEEKDI